MRIRLVASYAPMCVLAAFALSVLGMDARAESFASADALLAIDQVRASVVERIVDAWGPTLARSSDYVSVDDLRQRLMSLRADSLLAASVAGTERGLREVVGFAASASKPATQTKALGDASSDVVYTPVTPCRLVETRGTFAAVYQGNGPAHAAYPFAADEVRSYAIQSGNGVCLTQLPAGLKPAAVQLQVFGIPTTSQSGDIEILPQGSTFGSTATMVYIGTIAFNTVSTTARINPVNNEISVQVRGGGANLAMDVVGYFAAPKSSNTVTGSFATVAGGNINTASGAGAAVGGGQSNIASNTVATVGGGEQNTASGDSATVGGGGSNTAAALYSTVVGGGFNTASGNGATVLGGESNNASGLFAVAGGHDADANQSGCILFAYWTIGGSDCFNTEHQFRVMGDHGLSIDYGTHNADGTGTRWAVIGDTLTGKTIATWTNAYLSDGGAWVNASDRALKADFQAIDPLQVLAKVGAMPVTRWRYKSQPDELHLGPVAQDFHEAFGLGADDKHIATVDEAGVALAAIQGLNQLAREKEARMAAQQRAIARQENEIADLRDELNAVKRALAQRTFGAGPVAMHGSR